MLPFSSASEHQGINEQLLREYSFFLAKKAEETVEAYLRTARQVTTWIAGRPGNGDFFQSQQFTRTAVEMYLAALEREGFSLHHHARVKSALSTLARWLIEEKGLLSKNPTCASICQRCRYSRLANYQEINGSFSVRLSSRREIGAELRSLR
jgi:site-specific recombinase XerD